MFCMLRCVACCVSGRFARSPLLIDRFIAMLHLPYCCRREDGLQFFGCCSFLTIVVGKLDYSLCAPTLATLQATAPISWPVARSSNGQVVNACWACACHQVGSAMHWAISVHWDAGVSAACWASVPQDSQWCSCVDSLSVCQRGRSTSWYPEGASRNNTRRRHCRWPADDLSELREMLELPLNARLR